MDNPFLIPDRSDHRWMGTIGTHLGNLPIQQILIDHTLQIQLLTGIEIGRISPRSNGKDLRVNPPTGPGDPLTELIISGCIAANTQDRGPQLSVCLDIFRVQKAEEGRTASATHITSQKLILLSPGGTDQIPVCNELPTRMSRGCLFPFEELPITGSPGGQIIYIVRMIIRGDMRLG